MLAENVTRSLSMLKIAVNISSNSTLSSFTIVIFTHWRSLPDENASSVEEGISEKSFSPKNIRKSTICYESYIKKPHFLLIHQLVQC